jgi:prepilin peptidase CpaA
MAGALMSAELVKTFFAGIFTAIAAVMDYRKRKIKNNFVISVFAFSTVLLLSTESWNGFQLGLSSLAAAFIAILPLYLLKVVGGGDLKFFVAISPLMNWQLVVVTVIAALVWGSLLGVFQTLLRSEGKQLLLNLKLVLLRQKLKASELHQIPFCVALFFGYITALTLQQAGVQVL